MLQDAIGFNLVSRWAHNSERRAHRQAGGQTACLDAFACVCFFWGVGGVGDVALPQPGDHSYSGGYV